MEVKTEVNGTPLPQRNPANKVGGGANQPNAVDKKPFVNRAQQRRGNRLSRFNNQGNNQANNNNQGSNNQGANNQAGKAVAGGTAGQQTVPVQQQRQQTAPVQQQRQQTVAGQQQRQPTAAGAAAATVGGGAQQQQQPPGGNQNQAGNQIGANKNQGQNQNQQNAGGNNRFFQRRNQSQSDLPEKRGGPGGAGDRNDRNRERSSGRMAGGAGGANDHNRGDRFGDRGGDRGGDRDRKGGFDRARKSDEYLIAQRLKNLQGPMLDIPAIEEQELKFSGRNRLYVGNLPNDMTEPELVELFKPYGEIAETFLNSEKNFAFLKVDYRANAERAKRELDGSLRKNRSLRVRFAPNSTTLKVRNLTSLVSNELLYKAFEVFGNVERALVTVDDRGKPSGEGVVEFARKSGAMAALRFCTEKCYFLTGSLRPCVVELYEQCDDSDGYPEKVINKKSNEFFDQRQHGPRFAENSSFEHEYGTRWKQLHELYKQKAEALRNEMKLEEEKLEAQMEYARYEHETEMLREQLRSRELDREQRKTEWEMKERFAEAQRTKTEEQLRRTQEEIALRMNQQEEDLRRRQQENNLFMQAQLLLEQDGGKSGAANDLDRNNFDNLRGNNNGGRNFGQDGGFMDFDGVRGAGGGNARFDDQGNKPNHNHNHNNQRGGGNGGGVRQWNDSFQNKRRRF